MVVGVTLGSVLGLLYLYLKISVYFLTYIDNMKCYHFVDDTSLAIANKDSKGGHTTTNLEN